MGSFGVGLRVMNAVKGKGCKQKKYIYYAIYAKQCILMLCKFIAAKLHRWVTKNYNYRDPIRMDLI